MWKQNWENLLIYTLQTHFSLPRFGAFYDKNIFFSSKLRRVSSSHLHRKRLQIVSSNLPTIWNHLKLFETVPARHWGTFFKSYQQDNFKCLSNWKILLKKLFLFLANFHFYTQRRDVYPKMQWSWWFCLFKK